MVQYTQDGRRVYLTSVNPDEPGVYMVENVDGVDEPYTGDVMDLRVTPPQREKTTDPVKLAWLDQLRILASSAKQTSRRSGPNFNDEFSIGYNAGRIELAREILAILND